MGDKGELIVSTKAVAAGQKGIMIAVGGLLILLGMFMGVDKRVTSSIASGTQQELIHYCVITILIAFGGYAIYAAFKRFKSYCAVYEKGVVGTTGMAEIRDGKKDAPQQDFELAYSDIVNVTESGKTILIYTNYGTFEVLALKNRVEATQEIRKRMTGKKDGM